MDHNADLKLLNWNANGLQRQFYEFKHFLHDQKIDIACLTETHLNNSNKMNIPGYIIYRKDRNAIHTGGGVAIIIKRKIKHNPVIIPQNNNLEMVAISISLSVGNITLITAYKPPNKKLPIDIMETIFRNNNKIILLGDLNAKNQAWGCHTTTPQGKILLETAIKNNWIIRAPTQPTHYPYNKNIKPDILDIVLTQNVNWSIYQYAIPALNSDHNPILILFNQTTPTITSYNPLINGKINWSLFQKQIMQLDKYPKNLNTTNDIDQSVETFENNIKNAIKLSTIRQSHPNKIKIIPLPNDIINLIAYKHKIRRQWQISRSSSIKTILNSLTKKLKIN